MTIRSFTIALAILASIPAPSPAQDLPSDAALIREFHETRPWLEKIVAMTRQDRGERISTDFVRFNDLIDPSDAERQKRLPDSRWAEYRRLFALARVPNGIGFSADGVYFYKVDVGLAGYGESKGFVWLAEPLPADRLDQPADAANPRFLDHFERIDDHWYLEHSRS